MVPHLELSGGKGHREAGKGQMGSASADLQSTVKECGQGLETRCRFHLGIAFTGRPRYQDGKRLPGHTHVGPPR